MKPCPDNTVPMLESAMRMEYMDPSTPEGHMREASTYTGKALISSRAPNSASPHSANTLSGICRRRL